MTATIKDIAKRAEVSHSTVSRALRGSHLISDETAERVRQVARELGYHPSAVARSLKTNSTRVLGVVVSSIDDPFFSEILQGIDDAAQSAGYSLFIAASQRDPYREQKIVQAMMEHRADGVIICSTSFSKQQSQELFAYGRPIAVVNNQAAEDYQFSIYHDDMDGCSQVARHLINLGHQRIAYLSNSLSGRTTLDRMSGYQHEMAAAGLPVPRGFIHQVPGGDPGHGEMALGHFLALPHLPTALICYNDMMAIGIVKAMQQAGFRVPGDFSVTGFDNIVFSAYTNPPLTTFDQPKRSIGMEAAYLILEQLNTSGGDNGASPQQSIRKLKGKLLVRQSTAPPAPQRA